MLWAHNFFEWIVTIIAGVIIAAVAFVKLKGSPGDLGNGVTGAGKDAGDQLNKVRGY